MISSRCHILPHQIGTIRSDFIHGRLWRHCEHLIQRITFGAEKYSIAKTRTLGSIQALLLITEWHPRALHFPPDNDGWDASLATAVDDPYGHPPHTNEDVHLMRWRAEVFEPTKRSDRMSWMLVGLATTLAQELGVFDEIDQDFTLATNVDSHDRHFHIRRLLFLFTNQLALRLGCTTIFPQNCVRPPSTPSFPTETAKGQAGRERETMLSKWIELTKLTKTASDMLFPSKAKTLQLLRNFKYLGFMEHLLPVLNQWHKGWISLQLPSKSELQCPVALVC